MSAKLDPVELWRCGHVASYRETIPLVLFLGEVCLLTIMARLVVCVINFAGFVVSDLLLNFKG